MGWRPGPARRRSGEVAAASGGEQGPPGCRAGPRCGRGLGLGPGSAQPRLGLERPRRRPRPTSPARPGPRGALTWRRRRLQAPGSAARVPSAGCGSHNMATAVAGGAAAPGAERGREPAWRRDLAGAAGGGWGRGGGAGGRRLGPGHPPRAVRLRGCPGLDPASRLSPTGCRLPPTASCPRRAARHRPGGGDSGGLGGAGRGRCRAELDPRPRRPRPGPRPRVTRLPRRAPGAIPARRPLPATWASRSLTGLQGRGLRSGPRSSTRGPRSAYAAVSPQRTASASGAGTASSSLRSGT